MFLIGGWWGCFLCASLHSALHIHALGRNSNSSSSEAACCYSSTLTSGSKASLTSACAGGFPSSRLLPTMSERPGTGSSSATWLHGHSWGSMTPLSDGPHSSSSSSSELVANRASQQLTSLLLKKVVFKEMFYLTLELYSTTIVSNCLWKPYILQFL